MIRRRTLLGSALAAGAAALTGGPTPTAGARAAGSPDAAGTGAAARPVGDVPTGRYRLDVHAHTLPPDYRAALLEHGHLTIGGYPTPEWSPERAIDFMDRYGIEAQVLSVSDPGVSFLGGQEAGDLARYCNTYLADLVTREPRRFGALAVLPMPDVPASIAEMEYALDVLRLDGVVLLSAYDGVYLGDPRFEPLMHALAQRNAYVFVHPAAIPSDAKPRLPLPDFLMEFTFDTTRAATLLMAGGTLDRYPGIRFQLAHAGGTLPFLGHRIGVAAETPVGDLWPEGLSRPAPLRAEELLGRFLYDTALSASPAAMTAVREAAGIDRLVFGSDWPFSQLTLSGSGDPAPGLSGVFSAEERLRIERGNVLAQFPRLRQALGG